MKISKDFLDLIVRMPDDIDYTINKCIENVLKLSSAEEQLMFLIGLCIKSGGIATAHLQDNRKNFLKDLFSAIEMQFSLKKYECAEIVKGV